MLSFGRKPAGQGSAIGEHGHECLIAPFLDFKRLEPPLVGPELVWYPMEPGAFYAEPRFYE
jgi:hypothetical protein